jgi:hypothetical protein
MSRRFLKPRERNTPIYCIRQKPRRQGAPGAGKSDASGERLSQNKTEPPKTWGSEEMRKLSLETFDGERTKSFSHYT